MLSCGHDEFRFPCPTCPMHKVLDTHEFYVHPPPTTPLAANCLIPAMAVVSLGGRWHRPVFPPSTPPFGGYSRASRQIKCRRKRRAPVFPPSYSAVNRLSPSQSPQHTTISPASNYRLFLLSGHRLQFIQPCKCLDRAEVIDIQLPECSHCRILGGE